MEGLRPIVAEHHYFGSVGVKIYDNTKSLSRESTLGFLFVAATVGTNEDWPTLRVAFSSAAGAPSED